MRSSSARFGLVCVAAGAGVTGLANAHHSRAQYDMSTELVFEGVVAELKWSNPHVSMTVRTEDPDGVERLQNVEVMSVSEALAMGLHREAIAEGTAVVVRAHPSRRGAESGSVGIDVRTSDGRVLPLNTGAGFAIAPSGIADAPSIEGRWAPSVTEFNQTFPAMAQWPFTDTARASMQRTSDEPNAVLGICADYPPPMLSVFPDVREIRLGTDTVEMLFDAQGQNVLRIVHLDQASHPDDIEPSLLGHSIGHWEQQTLVVDTVAFEPNPVGIMVGVASGPDKHLVEKFMLSEDRRHLTYDVTLVDPAALTAPGSFSVQWDYRPDLEFSGVACDPDAAREILER